MHTIPEQLIPEQPSVLDLDGPVGFEQERSPRATPVAPLAAPGDFKSPRDKALATRALARRAHSKASMDWAHSIERYVQSCEAVERETPPTRDAREFYKASKRALTAARTTLEQRARQLLSADLDLVEIDQASQSIAVQR